MNDGYLRKVFPAGTEIFRSGDFGNCAYIIDEGEVEIGIPLNAHQIVYNRLGPGELFGEMALIDDHKRIGSAAGAERHRDACHYLEPNPRPPASLRRGHRLHPAHHPDALSPSPAADAPRRGFLDSDQPRERGTCDAQLTGCRRQA
jgi:hypothetical protein